MAKKSIPTETELAILQVLWDRGPSTVREVQESLSKDSGYTTVLKLMQIMYDKGLVDRHKEGRAHRYEPLIRKEETQQKMLGSFTEQLFGGSMQQLIQRAITSEKMDSDDLDEIEKLLQKLKSRDK
jgi:predicted transcriptional regulator